VNNCPRCDMEVKETELLCDVCQSEYEIEMHESMSEMFDSEGNNL
jgi:uncharacterized Zn ribbon protein